MGIIFTLLRDRKDRELNAQYDTTRLHILNHRTYSHWVYSGSVLRTYKCAKGRLKWAFNAFYPNALHN